MARIINEQRMIEENMLMFENRLKSPIRRFIDKSFVPARYWHIKANDTSVDIGYGDVAEIIGKDSPIRYQRIDGLPIYGLEQMVVELQDGDNGLDSGYDGEATIMSGTIVPLQNDFFILPVLRDAYVFRVTGVSYETIMSVNCYKISFLLEYIDTEKIDALNLQTQRDFTCVMENIGTDERCIIENSDKEKLDQIETMYRNVVDTLLTFYYNERYNCLLADLPDGMKLYDPFQAEFINKHGLFKYKHQLDGVVLSEQFQDPRRRLKYERSVYRCMELQRLDKLSTFPYSMFPGAQNRYTSFYRWLDSSIMVVDLPKTIEPLPKYHIFSEEFTEDIRLNAPGEHTKLQSLVKRFLRKEPLDLVDIPMDLEDDVMELEDANLEIFFLTPIVLFIIRKIINDHLANKEETSGFEDGNVHEV